METVFYYQNHMGFRVTPPDDTTEGRIWIIRILKNEVCRSRSALVSSHDQMIIDQTDRNYLLEN